MGQQREKAAWNPTIESEVYIHGCKFIERLDENGGRNEGCEDIRVRLFICPWHRRTAFLDILTGDQGRPSWPPDVHPDHPDMVCSEVKVSPYGIVGPCDFPAEAELLAIYRKTEHPLKGDAMRILDTRSTQYIFGVGGEITEVRCVLAKPLTIEEASQLEGKPAQVFVRGEAEKKPNSTITSMGGGTGTTAYYDPSPYKNSIGQMLNELTVTGPNGEKLGVSPIKKAFDEMVKTQLELEQRKFIAAAKELLFVPPKTDAEPPKTSLGIVISDHGHFDSDEMEYFWTSDKPPLDPIKADAEPAEKPVKFREFT